MKLILSDETLADEIAQNGRKTLDTMAALKELQRWRAAFAWFEINSCVIRCPTYESWWLVSNRDRTIHEEDRSLLEAIEALRAKVEVKP